MYFFFWKRKKVSIFSSVAIIYVEIIRYLFKFSKTIFFFKVTLSDLSHKCW